MEEIRDQMVSIAEVPANISQKIIAGKAAEKT
jgi:hypothetical protein